MGVEGKSEGAGAERGDPDSICKLIKRTAKNVDKLFIPNKLEAPLAFANNHKYDTNGRKES